GCEWEPRRGKAPTLHRGGPRTGGSRGHLLQPGVHRPLGLRGDPGLRARPAWAAQGQGLRARDPDTPARQIAPHAPRPESQELRGPVRPDQAARGATRQGARLQGLGPRATMKAGHFTLVLHSHLPWVLHHGRWPHGVDWLNEAAAETYLPLWRVLSERVEHGGAPRSTGPARRSLGVTLGMSPVLCEQLAHPDFQREFVSYLEQKIVAAAEDRKVFTRTGEGALAALAQRWEHFYRGTLEDFMGPHGADLVRRFRRLEAKGAIEIVTCGATHGYLPLLSRDSAAEGPAPQAPLPPRRPFRGD